MSAKRYFFTVLLMFKIVGLCAAGPSSQDASGWYQEGRDLYYGIPVQFRFFPENAQLADEVWAYLESINDGFNDYRAGSEIYTINRLNAAGDVSLSPMLAEAFRKARQAWTLSEGAFDITCAPIRDLWKQAAKTGVMPSDEEVAAARKRCGMNLVAQNGTRLTRLQAGVRFDFGGIIKGIIA
ncbi:MAG TPA: FAD:protein FMN transferase, partial [Tichowtungia sp.]|nr:FAD:protein FMN transferase [Tichowtungia sp.]